MRQKRNRHVRAVVLRDVLAKRINCKGRPCPGDDPLAKDRCQEWSNGAAF